METKQREFPRDYCEKCKRVTGTDYWTGECGGCAMKEYLERKERNRPEPIVMSKIMQFLVWKLKK